MAKARTDVTLSEAGARKLTKVVRAVERSSKGGGVPTRQRWPVMWNPAIRLGRTRSDAWPQANYPPGHVYPCWGGPFLITE